MIYEHGIVINNGIIEYSENGKYQKLKKELVSFS
jgi:hypothetical protein